MTAAVRLSNIRKSFGSNLVLNDVSLECHGGRVHALVGENGAGKSTLLKILSGVVRPDAGSLTIDERPIDLAALTPHQAQRLGISVVHQEFSLVPSLTVAENIFLGRELRGRAGIERSRMHEEAARLLQRLGSRLDPTTPVERVSVADAQLVEIAKALSLDARVVALDEPSAVLSGAELETLFGVIDSLRSHGVAVLYVSHRMDELFRLCDDFTVLKDGVVAGSGAMSSATRDDIVRLMVGRDVTTAFPPPLVGPGDVRLAVRQLRVPGLNEPVTLEVRAGEVLGVAGLAGSGRTRLAKAIFGALPARGQIIVDGEVMGPFRSPRDAIRAGIAYLPEDRKQSGLALTQTVSANATLLALQDIQERALLSTRREAQRAGSLIEQFSVRTSPTGADRVGRLSGGNQQKVVFAKWLQSNPRVVILDEPTRGIDIGSKEQIYRLIRRLGSTGVAFLLISSELVEVLGMSDRLVVLSDGALVAELPGGTTEEDVMKHITSTAHLAVPGRSG